MNTDYPILTKFHEEVWDDEAYLIGGRVMDFDISEDLRTVKFTEGCDKWFSVTLTKQELLQLAEELKQLANTLRD